MVITASTYLIVLPLVFLAAAVDAISGGGGLISLPAYTMAGLSYDLAAGSNKLSSSFGSLIATVRYARAGKVLLRPALWAILGALPGSYLGTRAAMALGNRIMSGIMVVAIPIVGALVIFKPSRATQPKPMTRAREALCLLTGLVTGFYDGFFGPGTGTFLILLFTYLTSMDMVSASATAKPVNLTSNLSSLLTRIAAGDVLYAVAVPAIACSLAGGWIGSRLALTQGAKLVRWVMIGVLILLTVKLAADLIA